MDGTRANQRTVSRNGVMAIAGAFALCSSASWAATLTWNANTEPDLAGYRVYVCAQQPCTRSSGTLLATLGKVLSVDVGTPTVVQYYVVTAYDSSNNESIESNVTTYTPPTGTPPTPPPPATVSLTVLGSPSIGEPWSVRGTTTATGTISMQVWVNGVFDHSESTSPYCAFGDANGVCTKVLKPFGSYTVEFRVLSGGTEVARQSLSVTAAGPAAPPPAAPPPAPGNLRLSLVQ